jgi:hypothetical protein
MFHASRHYSRLMQAAVEPSPASSSFAGVLASLTRAKIQPSTSWEDDLEHDLEPDVATLSYERALSANACHRQGHTASQLPEDPATRAAAAALQPDSAPELASRAPAERAADQRTSTALEEKRMRASVTLRMSKAEFAQLQQRAAEAGLTVSAYLRSCTFEVETLRAQVKQALVELRAAKAESSQPQRTSRLAYFLELMRIRRPAVA